jgi:hypothetical protein
LWFVITEEPECHAFAAFRVIAHRIVILAKMDGLQAGFAKPNIRIIRFQ